MGTRASRVGTLLVVVCISLGTQAFGTDTLDSTDPSAFGYVTVGPANVLDAKAGGNVTGENGPAGLYVQVTYNSVVYYLIVEEASSAYRSMASLLLVRLSMGESLHLTWVQLDLPTYGVQYKRVRRVRTVDS